MERSHHHRLFSITVFAIRPFIRKSDRYSWDCEKRPLLQSDNKEAPAHI